MWTHREQSSSQIMHERPSRFKMGFAMARIRTIKPEFPHSETMGRISRDARLCFIMIWTICDDAGRARGSSRMLASLLYPYDDDAPKLTDKWLSELERGGCIRRYRVGAETYLECCNWLKHQKIDKPSASRLPAPDVNSRGFESIREASATDLVPRTMDQDLGSGPSKTPPEGGLVVHKKSSLPDWLDQEAWNGFVEMRGRVKAPLTARGRDLIIAKLDKLRLVGDDPAMILDQSTQNSWKGVFPLKQETANGNGRKSAHENLVAGGLRVIEGSKDRDSVQIGSNYDHLD